MSLPIISDQEMLCVTKPAQYMGGESGSVLKTDSEVELHFCLAFPDTYEVGMSHIGFQILYDLINRDPKVWAERVYAPLQDMDALLRKRGAPLRSLEGKRPLSQFDIVGFSLQYELCMSGILNILDLGGISLLQKERTENMPLVIGGGPVCYHPEPFSDFFDCFLIGDGEELVPEFIALMRQAKKEGLTRKEKLERASQIQGVYVPSLFEPLYEFNAESSYPSHGIFRGFKALKPGYEKITRRIIPTLEGAPYPTNPVVPNIKAVHDRLSVEIMRGCVRGCRFCQAGYLYRPQRERSPEDILKIVGDSLKNTGYEELSLLSLSSADYCSILPLLSSLKQRFAPNDDLAISFPSTRVDALTPELLQEVQPIRRSGFTIAPEAGTQRLRDVINKGVTDEEIIETCSNVFKLGWNSVKMYFMLGLPTETDQDILGIIDLGRRVKKIAGHHKDVTVSVSTLVPKPHTPFQWAASIAPGEILRKQQLLARELKRSGITFRYHDSDSTVLETIFARGDRQLGRVILKAYQLGCRLDGWTEQMRFESWMQAFAECGIDPMHYLHERKVEEPLPWDHISCDIPKRYFLKEWKRACEVRTTPDCLTQSCSVCGACDYDAVRNVLFDRERSEKRLGISNPPWQKIIELKKQGLKQDLLDKAGAVPNRDSDQLHKIKHEPGGSYNLRDYLRTETDTSGKRRTRGVLGEKQRIRVRYQKSGISRFISHLELANIFFRAARRGAVPISFTQGFNPRPRMSFGPPLQLGLESDFEFVDLFLSAEILPQELISRMNPELSLGLKLLEARSVDMKADSLQAIITNQRYLAKLDRSAFESFEFSESWPERQLERVRKGSRSNVFLKDFVERVVHKEDQLDFTLPYRDDGSALKPFEAIAALTGLDANLFEIRKIGSEFRA